MSENSYNLIAQSSITSNRVDRLLSKVRGNLLEAFESDHWEGELSSSALSTAVAVIALRVVDEQKYAAVIQFGLDWLNAHTNTDGGFGDTIDCPSNLSTSLLVWSAFSKGSNPALENLETWILSQTGSLEPEDISEKAINYYGKDRTFSVPILMTCALSGRLGADAWKYVPQLPFELAALPKAIYRFVGMQVVSYALPALISIGWVRFHSSHRILCPLSWLRVLLKPLLFRKLNRIQPENGGFLEATPLTAFVVMSLAASGSRKCDVVEKGALFLLQSIRSDGSWPIDTHLATWLTSLSVKALSSDMPNPKQIRCWLKSQQGQTVHPFTGAKPGGWAWTPFAGGVPDADDTSGALLALFQLQDQTSRDEQDLSSIKRGFNWLLDLQNRDGGMPTFCRGWGKLPFDCSSPDVTAHALHAFHTYQGLLDYSDKKKIHKAINHGTIFLKNNQREDGAWIPLWFGNPWSPYQENPVYGTSRVLCTLSVMDHEEFPVCRIMQEKGIRWLLKSQNPDGGWGVNGVGESTVEETALVLEALAGSTILEDIDPVLDAGFCFLEIAWGLPIKPTPIGLYFASLWYSEPLYPTIFSLSALQALKARLTNE